MKIIGKQTLHIVQICLYVLGIVYISGLLFGTDADAKKRRRASAGAFQISEVTTSPSPYEVGNGELTFSAIVKVPKNLNGLAVLEVSALITSPTQRSMRFLTQRVPLGSKPPAQRGPRISTVLVWDGKDQSNTFVVPGTYQYEVRAKLMAEKGAGIEARRVSRRSRGAVEVIKYHAPPSPPPLKNPQSIPDLEVDDSSASVEGDAQEEAAETVDDEVEMLIDESTSHPLPEPGDPGIEIIEEEEVLAIPQED
ncbi:MAG: hypothetical protein NPIRA05_04830 [Nitrospirales bacterium]|nr:MAG: hypothetical protein NPIRA05_04830 [Nitrospirales bacterium]